MLSWEESQSISSMRCDRAWVEVNLEAIACNVRHIKGLLSPKTDLMAVIKADAYGHGAVTVAQTVLKAGANWLGVATIPEGIELREAGIVAPVQVLGATYTPEQLRSMVRWRLQPTLCTPKQALVFSESASEYNWTVPVHVKLDTGMSRLGAPWEGAAEFVQLVRRLPQLELASIYSHLATADSEDPTVMELQHQRFKSAIAQIQEAGIPLPRLHLANSAGTFSDRSLHYDMVRVGLGIYGLYPAPHLRSRLSLQSALQVKARVTHIKAIEAGTGVSYGHRFIADRDMKIAVIGIGYADGVPRNLSNQMEVSIRGQKVRQIGSITMDQMMVDVSHLPDLELGEVVTLLGRDGKCEISADDWADRLGTISWEILCGFKHRLPRIAVGHALERWEQTAKS